MRFIKAALACMFTLGMASCHPVMAAPNPTKIKLAEVGCQVADQYTRDIMLMMRDDRSNLEIMSWLDSVTPDAEKEPQGYLGIMWTKLNVSNVRMALGKAYKEGAIRQKTINNCLDSINQEFTIVRK
ncbi:hypothetical protein [Pseudomonas phage D6]|nr:hypothetical protein [Pseudomonas phage D6]